MDSCHIFNFLFGTRKTTDELRKHFQSSVNEANGKHCKINKSTIEAGNSSNKCQKEGQQLPSSPLKQIQLKIANLTNSAKKIQTDTGNRLTEAEPNSGTYRATLVEPIDDCDYDDLSKVPVDENNNSLLTTNESHSVGQLIDEHPSDVSNIKLHSHKGKYAKCVVLYDETPYDGDNAIVASADVFEISSTSRNSSGISPILRRIDGATKNQEAAEDITAKSRRDEFSQNYNDKKSAKSEHVKNLVQSFELSANSQLSQQSSESTDTPRTPIKLRWPPEQGPFEEKQVRTKPKEKPYTIVKPQPPRTPPKSNKVKFLNLQLRLGKPTKIEQLFQYEPFLVRLFSKLEPIDRCTAAQVCRSWRDILYSNQNYWRDLISVIDCTQLRREHLLECIVNTLQSAKLKHLNQLALNNHQQLNGFNQYKHTPQESSHISTLLQRNGQMTIQVDNTDLDQDEVWRIQELCQKFARGSSGCTIRSLMNEHHPHSATVNGPNQHQIDNHQTITSKSSSIPSQISSTISSASISSLLSPLSESSRVDSIRGKLYTALDDRGFDAICLYGASDDDIEDLVSKTPPGMHKRILVGRLDNGCITDRGLELFISTFDQMEELELSGCNEITNSIELKILQNLRRLIITDCINIADGLASRLVQIFHQLTGFTIQAYHLTDAFFEYISLNSDTSRLQQLELSNCKEITNHSMLTIAKHFRNVERLSISGSTKISDDGIEILGEQSKKLSMLDLSWCTKITDISLECIACDLSANLRELILDRNINISDIGLGYLATMTNLTLLYIRWCSRITDVGLESVLTIRSLRQLSLAGLHQITARSLLCLIETVSLEEVELTNCPAVNNDLLEFLSSKMPKCNLIF